MVADRPNRQVVERVACGEEPEEVPFASAVIGALCPEFAMKTGEAGNRIPYMETGNAGCASLWMDGF